MRRKWFSIEYWIMERWKGFVCLLCYLPCGWGCWWIAEYQRRRV